MSHPSPLIARTRILAVKIVLLVSKLIPKLATIPEIVLEPKLLPHKAAKMSYTSLP